MPPTAPEMPEVKPEKDGFSIKLKYHHIAWVALVLSGSGVSAETVWRLLNPSAAEQAAIEAAEAKRAAQDEKQKREAAEEEFRQDTNKALARLQTRYDELNDEKDAQLRDAKTAFTKIALDLAMVKRVAQQCIDRGMVEDPNEHLIGRNRDDEALRGLLADNPELASFLSTKKPKKKKRPSLVQIAAE